MTDTQRHIERIKDLAHRAAYAYECGEIPDGVYLEQSIAWIAGKFCIDLDPIVTPIMPVRKFLNPTT